MKTIEQGCLHSGRDLAGGAASLKQKGRTGDDGLRVPRAIGVDVRYSLVHTPDQLQREAVGAVLVLGRGRRVQAHLLHSAVAPQHCDPRLVQRHLAQQSGSPNQTGSKILDRGLLGTSAKNMPGAVQRISRRSGSLLLS